MLQLVHKELGFSPRESLPIEFFGHMLYNYRSVFQSNEV